MQLYDSLGVPLKGPLKNSATAYREAFTPGLEVMNIVVNAQGLPTAATSVAMARAQVPWLVTLLVYKSKFQLVADRREYFVYAGPDMRGAVKLAFGLWRRWEKPRRKEEFMFDDMREDYPKVDDAAVAEPIDDNFFDEMWRAIRGRQHKCAGDPRDPFAFTCADPDVMVYKHADFQSGLSVTI